MLTRFSLILLFVAGTIRASEPPPVMEIVEGVVRQEDRNYEEARHWEYTLKTTTQRLDGEGRVVREKESSIAYRPKGALNYGVSGLDQGGEKAEVGFGFDGNKADVSESIRMRELLPFYEFELGGAGEVDGVPVWLVDFAPRPEAKARNMRQKVLTRLKGRLWVDQRELAIRRSECALPRPMPFVWFDLVSLRELRIRYEAFHHEGKVWMPREMEFSYVVRIFYFNHIRQRQKLTTADFHRLAETEDAENGTTAQAR